MYKRTLVVQTFTKKKQDKSIILKIDNVTAVAYIPDAVIFCKGPLAVLHGEEYPHRSTPSGSPEHHSR